MNKKLISSTALVAMVGFGLYKWSQKQTAPSDKAWTTANIPDLTNKVVIVTGANSGIGFETAKELARKGAKSILACRSLDKAQAAMKEIQVEIPGAVVEIMALDLADLDSVRAFVATFKAKYNRLDILVNNAGIMMPPYGKTAQNFESQIGVNHLGHFALTALLFDLILQTPQSRIVNVSSSAHRFGQMDFDDLHWERKDYSPGGAYGQSKLANLLFSYELQRKLGAMGQDSIVTASHPGWTETNLQQHSSMATALNPYFAQSQAMGALPTLRAATDPQAQGGDFYGPKGFMEMRGYPVLLHSTDASYNLADARKLWDLSEELTGVRFAVPA